MTPCKRDLTYREVSILNLIKEGYSHSEIASKLGISTAVVKMSLRFIYARLNAVNAAHAVTLALRAGFINLQDEGGK